MDNTLIYLAAFAALVAVAVATAIITVRHDGRNAGEILARLVVWVGIAALLMPARAVGTALAFGGLCTLTAGYYSYWDGMGDAPASPRAA